MKREAGRLVIEKVNEVNAPGKIALQKLVYLVQRRGVDLRLAYQIHLYGPYSSALDYLLQGYERQGIIAIEHSGSSSFVKPRQHLWDRVKEQDLNGELQTTLTRIERSVTKYAGKSPRYLELFTTIDYVALDMSKKDSVPSKMDVFRVVKKLKGNKFEDEEIHNVFCDICADDELSPTVCLS